MRLNASRAGVCLHFICQCKQGGLFCLHYFVRGKQAAWVSWATTESSPTSSAVGREVSQGDPHPYNAHAGCCDAPLQGWRCDPDPDLPGAGQTPSAHGVGIWPSPGRSRPAGQGDKPARRHFSRLSSCCLLVRANPVPVVVSRQDIPECADTQVTFA